MDLLVAFALTLVVAVPLSGLARRSILSLAVLFLAAGFLSGRAVLGLGESLRTEEVVFVLAEAALFAVLFTDGIRISLRELWASRGPPIRALAVGAPLALAAMVVLAHWLIGLSWTQSLLVAAVLSPTDPVYASAIIGREDVPRSLRSLLNIESGVNDGLALPVVVVGLDVLGRARRVPCRWCSSWPAVSLSAWRFRGSSDG